MTKIIISKKIGENLVVDFELTEDEKNHIYNAVNKDLWRDKIIEEIFMIPKQNLEGHDRNFLVHNDKIIEEIYYEFSSRRNIRQPDLESLKEAIFFTLGEYETVESVFGRFDLK